MQQSSSWHSCAMQNKFIWGGKKDTKESACKVLQQMELTKNYRAPKWTIERANYWGNVATMCPSLLTFSTRETLFKKQNCEQRQVSSSFQQASTKSIDCKAGLNQEKSSRPYIRLRWTLCQQSRLRRTMHKAQLQIRSQSQGPQPWAPFCSSIPAWHHQAPSRMLHSGLVDWITTPMIRNHQKQLPQKKTITSYKDIFAYSKGQTTVCLCFQVLTSHL